MIPSQIDCLIFNLKVQRCAKIFQLALCSTYNLAYYHKLV